MIRRSLWHPQISRPQPRAAPTIINPRSRTPWQTQTAYASTDLMPGHDPKPAKGQGSETQRGKSVASIPWSKLNKSESATPKRQVKPPSPSASIILVSPTNKILLLHRVQTSSAFPSAHVFPGGNLESSDGEIPPSHTDPARHADNIAYRTGAIRELFEESGILLARETSSTTSPLLALPTSARLQGRRAIHNYNTDIKTWLASQRSTAVLDTEALLPFTRWITPTNVPKRFTTQMYLYFLPVSAAQDPDSLVATSDEVETMAPEWRTASAWLDRARSGEIILFPPQFLLLYLAGQFLDADGGTSDKSELEARREKLRRFVNEDGSPPWREKIISPTALSFTTDDGRSVLGLDKPGPELRGAEGIKGDDSRVVFVRFSEAGPRDVEVRMRKEVREEERAKQQNKGPEGGGSKL